MLAWVALFFEGPSSGRRQRQRRDFAGLDWAVYALLALALARAIELTGIAGRPSLVPNTAGPGFRRRKVRASLRRCAGSRFRRAFRHNDPRVRLTRLRCAFADLDTFARDMFAARVRRGLTRTVPVIIVAPPAQAIPAYAAPAPIAADSS